MQYQNLIQMQFLHGFMHSATRFGKHTAAGEGGYSFSRLDFRPSAPRGTEDATP